MREILRWVLIFLLAAVGILILSRGQVIVVRSLLAFVTYAEAEIPKSFFNPTFQQDVPSKIPEAGMQDI